MTTLSPTPTLPAVLNMERTCCVRTGAHGCVAVDGHVPTCVSRVDGVVWCGVMDGESESESESESQMVSRCMSDNAALGSAVSADSLFAFP